MIKYSIVIPLYNQEKDLNVAVDSCLEQQGPEFELLLVNDCSTDTTGELITKLAQQYPDKIKALNTPRNSGPGGARNIGLEHASGDWILFLDGDDRFAPGAFAALDAYIKSGEFPNANAVAFNWKYDNRSTVITGRSGGRYDFTSLHKTKTDLIKDSISLGMDGSVVYTAIKHDLIKNNHLRFRHGVHEDVDFIFKTYWLANKIGSINKVLYLKNNREGSIINSISESHIKGYFNAYREILDFLKAQNSLTSEYIDEYYIGLMGIIATRVKEICERSKSPEEAERLYKFLYDQWLNITSELGGNSSLVLQTRYAIIFEKFISLMNNQVMITDKTNSVSMQIKNFIDEIRNKSWSCYDLHNSIFLAPNEVRTCCKRFFINGEMKGDVPIIVAENDEPLSVSPDKILQAKKDLYMDINRGKCDACQGCPFLEFKEWGYIEKLDIEHLSLEYHSVCNMKCTYCSENYYGGADAQYNVEHLMKDLFDQGSLDNCRSVVWGGGEPALGKYFEAIANMIAENCPDVKQRILTNCIKYSEKINTLLARDKATLLTSIDAGTKETFSLIRGNTQFKKVFKNLERYARSNTKNTTIKYIFTDGNTALDEVEAFVNLIVRHNLLDCSFQISSDFKKETIDPDIAVSMIMLYALLIKAGCRLVYFDELLRQRFPKMRDEIKTLKAQLASLGFGETIADESQYNKVVIWGAGHQTQLLLENSVFFSDVDVLHIVDSTPHKIGTKFMGYDVLDPSTLLNSHEPVLISAVQNSPLIHEKYVKLGLDESRLIKGIIL